MYNADVITNTVLYIAHTKKIIVRPMKLQKLLYFTHGYYSAQDNHHEKKSGLIKEHFEAWTYGPVIPNVYHTYKMLRDDTIKDYMSNSHGEYYKTSNKDVCKIIEDIVQEYGEYTDFALSNLTHMKHGAWNKAFQKKPGSEIDQQDIVKEFKIFIKAIVIR